MVFVKLVLQFKWEKGSLFPYFQKMKVLLCSLSFFPSRSSLSTSAKQYTVCYFGLLGNRTCLSLLQGDNDRFSNICISLKVLRDIGLEKMAAGGLGVGGGKIP